MAKRIIFTAIGLIVVVGLLGGIKALQIKKMIAQGAQFSPPPETVTTALVSSGKWETLITAVGSLEAVQGVMVSAELPGKVIRIAFDAGAKVKAGDVLLQQDVTSEEAQLRSATANAELARITLKRTKKLLPEKVSSQADYDNAQAAYTQAVAQADTIRAAIGKKTIRAPFAGKLGIRLVNLGQMINAGEQIVSLQSLDPIYVDFLLPQQQLAQVRQGYPVRITGDVLEDGEAIEGTITAINPQVDRDTRNVRLQATLSNPQERLRPGMFVNVAVVLPEEKQVVTIPATAVAYAPYSNSVFVVETGKKQTKGKPGMVVRQQFVELGEKRGDFVAVQSGLTVGQTLVSTGVFKLRNGQSVVVDNALAPDFKLAPNPEES